MKTTDAGGPLPRLMAITPGLDVLGGPVGAVEYIEALVRGGVRMVQIRVGEVRANVEVAQRVRRCVWYDAAVVLCVNGGGARSSSALGLAERELTAPQMWHWSEDLWRSHVDEIESMKSPCSVALHLNREASPRLDEVPSNTEVVVVSPVLAPNSKPGAGVGLDALRAFVARTDVEDKRGPQIYALGGVCPDSLGPMLACGVHGVAALGWFQPAPFERAQTLVEALSEETRGTTSARSPKNIIGS